MNLYYLSVPRTGSTYVKSVLKHDDRFFYFDYTENKTQREALFEQFFKEKENGEAICFTTIRNPFNLLVSWWFKKHQINSARGHIPSFSIPECSLKHVDIDHYNFNKFVHLFFDTKFPSDSYQYYQQKMLYYYLFDKDGNCVPDFVLRTENLTEELFKLTNKYKITIKSNGNMNASNNKDNYKTYYDKDLRKFVERNVQTELNLFGYNFDGVIKDFNVKALHYE